jgi:hypothetical protein
MIVGSPYTYLMQLLLEAGAFLAIAIVASGRLRDGSWAGLVALGGLVLAIVPVLSVGVWFEGRLFETSRLLEFLFINHPHLNDVLNWSRPIGAVLIGAGVVLVARVSHRAPRWS